MAVNQVIYGGETLMDVTDSTVSEETLLAGAVAYNAAGERIVGTVVTVKLTHHSVTLTTGGWGAVSAGDYAYEQSVTIPGVTITADTPYDLDIAQSGTDAEADALILEAFGLVTYSNGVDGSIIFRCPTDKPGVNIPLDIRIYA